MRILVVEDNEFNRDMLSRRLLRRGHEVVNAATGEESLKLAGDIHPDVILMDLGLPGMDGYEATRRLKQSKETQSIPVIALTAHAMQSDRERAHEAGCDGYETKPIDFQRLMTKLQTLTRRVTA